MDDDDFSDFGGFEAAEPVGERQAAQLQAQASPWVAFASGSPHDRPDLLCAQNRFPTYLDPSDISGASAAPENANHVELPQVQPNADLLDGALFGEIADQPEQGLIEGNILDAAVAPYHQNQNVNGRLPDIGLGNNENRLFAQPVLNGALVPDLPVAVPGVAPDDGAMEEVPPPGDPEEIERREEAAEVRQEAQEVVVQEVAQAAEGAAPADRFQDRLQEQLDSLQSRNAALEEELQVCQGDLATQRSRLQEVEERHSATLQEVRAAGHDAISLVVEQYKEQTKTVIMEQQEAAKLQLLQTLNQQMKSFQDLLAAQRQNHEEEREREKQELQRNMDGAVQEACRQEQEKFQVFLQEEQEKWKVKTAKALEEERAVCEEKIKEVVKAEHDMSKNRLDEARAEYVSFLEEGKKTHEEALSRVRAEEIEKAKEKMSELVIEERERSKECGQKAMEAVRADMRTYTSEQQQAESRVRQRHLTSLDLFLESARQQINLLLDSEKPEATPREDPRREASEQS